MVGAVVQLVEHFVSQVLVHVVTGMLVQVAEQVAVNSTGVHCALQPPETSKWQVLMSLIVTSPRLVWQVVPANALDAEKRGAARASAPKEAFRKKRFIFIDLL